MASSTPKSETDTDTKLLPLNASMAPIHTRRAETGSLCHDFTASSNVGWSGSSTWLVPLGLRNCQDLWIEVFQATSVSVDSAGSVGVMSMGRSSSLPLWNTAPARTRATRCGALTARHRVWAASMSL